MLSKRDIFASINGDGYFVSPDNKIYKLSANENHIDWLRNHLELVKKYDSSADSQSKEFFKEAFRNGWVSIRLATDEKDFSKPFVVVSAQDIDILTTLPEDVKNLLFANSYIDFIDMSENGKLTHISKEEMEKTLHRLIYR